MSTDPKIVGNIAEKFTPQPAYPKISKNAGLWEFEMLWFGKDEDCYAFSPGYRMELADVPMFLDDKYKITFGKLLCSTIDIQTSDTYGYSLMSVRFISPEAPELESEEWTTNSVYKEVLLDPSELDVDVSGSESLEEAQEAELKRLKELGQGTRGTAEVRLVHKKTFTGQLNVPSIIGTIGDDIPNPAGIPSSSSGTWKHVGRDINKTKDEKIETNTYQFFNETE